MKILNRQTLNAGRYKSQLPIVTISKSGKMVFTKNASSIASIEAGQLLEFLIDQGKLYLKKTLDPAGFPVVNNNSDGSFCLSCRELFEALSEYSAPNKTTRSVQYKIKTSSKEPIAGFLPYELELLQYKEDTPKGK